jgi:hypothetical protein
MNFRMWFESSTRQPFVYHVTYWRNLDLIASQGLDYTQGSPNFPQSWLQQNSAQGSFFTNDPQYISRWVSTLEDHAYAKSDHVDEDGFVPIVLRFRLNPKKQQPDPRGETPADRFTDRLIPPEGIQIWNSQQWLPLSYWESVNLETFLDRQVQDGEELVYIKHNYPLPSA